MTSTFVRLRAAARAVVLEHAEPLVCPASAVQQQCFRCSVSDAVASSSYEVDAKHKLAHVVLLGYLVQATWPQGTESFACQPLASSTFLPAQVVAGDAKDRGTQEASPIVSNFQL